MPTHHYIPATFLANFSHDTGKVRRNRRIAAFDLEKGSAFDTSITNVAGINNLYKLSNRPTDPEYLERSWQRYEASLDTAISALLSQETDAIIWLRVLVPFAAGLMVRGPGFTKIYEKRPVVVAASALKNLEDRIHNSNMARAIELQRLLTLVMAAEWTLGTTPEKELLITSDLGFAPFVHIGSGRHGIAIPLDPRHVLILSIRDQGLIASTVNGIWRPAIHYMDLDRGDPAGINKAIIHFAGRFVFGCDQGILRSSVPTGQREPATAIDAGGVGFDTSRKGHAHQYGWHRLAAMLARPEGPSVDNPFPLDWSLALSDEHWNPIVFLPLMEEPFCPQTLIRNGDDIYVDLHDVVGWPRAPVVPYVERFGISQAEAGYSSSGER